jgi:hypothetical protein
MATKANAKSFAFAMAKGGYWFIYILQDYTGRRGTETTNAVSEEADGKWKWSKEDGLGMKREGEGGQHQHRREVGEKMRRREK